MAKKQKKVSKGMRKRRPTRDWSSTYLPIDSQPAREQPQRFGAEDWMVDLRIDDKLIPQTMTIQASNFFAVAERWSRAVSRRDRLKDEIERTRARLHSEIGETLRASRQDERITQTEIKEEVEASPTLAKLANQLRDAEEASLWWFQLKEAWVMRSVMLSGLARTMETGGVR